MHHVPSNAPDPADPRTLLCERCGYVIEGLPEESACPECGKPIVQSLPERRNLRVANGPLWSVYRNAFRTIRHPLRTLDRTPISRSVIDAGLWTRIHAAGWVGMTFTVMVFCFGVLRDDGPDRMLGGVIALTISSFVGGTLAFLLIQLLTWIEVRGLMLFGKQRGSRVTGDVSRTICAHGSAGWLIAAVGCSLCGIAASLTWALFAGVRDHDGYTSPTLPGWGWTVVELSPLVALGSIAIGFLFFETFAWLGLRRLKFANMPRPGVRDIS